MRELITVDAFSRWVTVGAVAWLVGAVVVHSLPSVRRRPRPVERALAWALIGPVALSMWRLYLWTVRVDPQTGYVGLHRVGVFAINAVVFIIVGALLGVMFARLHAPQPTDD